jgi:hypothetical protein
MRLIGSGGLTSERIVSALLPTCAADAVDEAGVEGSNI